MACASTATYPNDFMVSYDLSHAVHEKSYQHARQDDSKHDDDDEDMFRLLCVLWL